MAQWNEKKFETTSVNGGNEFQINDSLSVNDMNNIVKGLLYATNNSSGGGSNNIVEISMDFDGGETNAIEVISNYFRNSYPLGSGFNGKIFIFKLNDTQNIIENWVVWFIDEDCNMIITNFLDFWFGDYRYDNFERYTILEGRMALNRLEEFKQENAENIEILQEQIDNNIITIEKQQKEIENLKYANEGKTYIIETLDNNEPIPTNALPYASINAIYGLSTVSKTENKILNYKTTQITSKYYIEETDTFGLIDLIQVPKEFLELEDYGKGVVVGRNTAYNWIDIPNMIYHQECKEIILDGSNDELWETRPSYTNWDRYVLNLNTNSLSIGAVAMDFEYVKTINDDAKQVINNNATQIIVNFSEKGTSTLDAFKTWLRENPITIVYKLNEDIKTNISHIEFNPILKVQDIEKGTFEEQYVNFESEDDEYGMGYITYQVKVV